MIKRLWQALERWALGSLIPDIPKPDPAAMRPCRVRDCLMEMRK
jgi:hypothetical protein